MNEINGWSKSGVVAGGGRIAPQKEWTELINRGLNEYRGINL